MKKALYLFSLILIFSCSEESLKNEEKLVVAPSLVEGSWLLEFHLSETNIAPVNFTLTKKNDEYQVEFSNAEEKIVAKK